MNGAAPNAALRPNTSTLKVGDQTATPLAHPEPKPERKVRVPFGSYLEPELQRRFKAACVLRGTEMQDALDEALRAWLDKNTPAS